MSEEDKKYASKLFNSDLGLFVGLGTLAACVGIGVGAGFYGYNSGNVQTVRIETDFNSRLVEQERTRLIKDTLEKHGEKLSPKELSDILKALAEPMYKIETAEKKNE